MSDLIVLHIISKKKKKLLGKQLSLKGMENDNDFG